MEYLLIGAGAVLGANLRYVIGVWALERFGAGFPTGTLLINVTGSLAIGLFFSVLGERVSGVPNLRLFFVTGFLGAYTTFSAFSYEVLGLIQRDDWVGAALYAGSSVALGLAGAVLGVVIGRMIYGT